MSETFVAFVIFVVNDIQVIVSGYPHGSLKNFLYRALYHSNVARISYA